MTVDENVRRINDLIQKNWNCFQILINALNLDVKQNQFNTSQNEFVFTPDVFLQIANVLAVTFDNEKHEEGNVCFANNKDLRSEFKDRFSSEDVLNCLHAVLNLEVENAILDAVSIQKIVERNNKAEIQKRFWELVEIGSKARLNIL